jgi:hypothetical protein
VPARRRPDPLSNARSARAIGPMRRQYHQHVVPESRTKLGVAQSKSGCIVRKSVGNPLEWIFANTWSVAHSSLMQLVFSYKDFGARYQGKEHYFNRRVIQFVTEMLYWVTEIQRNRSGVTRVSLKCARGTGPTSHLHDTRVWPLTCMTRGRGYGL